MRRKVKQGWQRAATIGQLYRSFAATSRTCSQFVKKGVCAAFEWRNARTGRIRQCFANKVHGIVRCLVAKNFLPLTTLDLREFEFHVIGIHAANFFFRGRAEHFDNFDQLIDTGIAWKQ